MPRLLLIEPIPILELLLGMCLRNAGYTVTVAEDAAMAVECIKLQLPDVIVCEMLIHDQASTWLWQPLQASSVLVPLVLLSEEPAPEPAFVAKATAVLIKPFPIMRLLDLLALHTRPMEADTMHNVRRNAESQRYASVGTIEASMWTS